MLDFQTELARPMASMGPRGINVEIKTINDDECLVRKRSNSTIRMNSTRWRG